MKENVGGIDRITRFIVGPGLMLLGISQLTPHRVLGVLTLTGGTGILASAVTRVCPINAVLGLDTTPPEAMLQRSRALLAEQTARAIAAAQLFAVADSAARLA